VIAGHAHDLNLGPTTVQRIGMRERLRSRYQTDAGVSSGPRQGLAPDELQQRSVTALLVDGSESGSRSRSCGRLRFVRSERVVGRRGWLLLAQEKWASCPPMRGSEGAAAAAGMLLSR
jgi:hypothetical protein